MTRLLNTSPAHDPHTEGSEISLTDFGLLLGDMHQLRQDCARVMPRDALQDFLRDAADLVDAQAGVGRQQQAIDRIARYSWDWLH